MKYTKFAIMTLIIMFAFSLISTHVNAIDMFLTSNSLTVENNDTSSDTQNNTLENDVLDDNVNKTSEEDEPMLITSAPSETTGYSNSTHIITSREATSSDELTTSDIINIILIAVGIVIILLAVAILIRCK